MACVARAWKGGFPECFLTIHCRSMWEREERQQVLLAASSVLWPTWVCAPLLPTVMPSTQESLQSPAAGPTTIWPQASSHVFTQVCFSVLTPDAVIDCLAKLSWSAFWEASLEFPSLSRSSYPFCSWLPPRSQSQGCDPLEPLLLFLFLSSQKGSDSLWLGHTVSCVILRVGTVVWMLNVPHRLMY